MRTFETAQDVLHNARELHHVAGKLYRQLRDGSRDERSRMLLGYMSEHERKMEDSLITYEQHASRPVLETWMQYTLEDSPQDFISNLNTSFNMTPTEIAELGQRVDDYLVDLFEEVTDTASSIELKEVFQNLIDMEHEEKHNLTRAANSLWEL